MRTQWRAFDGELWRRNFCNSNIWSVVCVLQFVFAVQTTSYPGVMRYKLKSMVCVCVRACVHVCMFVYMAPVNKYFLCWPEYCKVDHYFVLHSPWLTWLMQCRLQVIEMCSTLVFAVCVMLGCIHDTVI